MMSHWTITSLRRLLILAALAPASCGGSPQPRLFMLSASQSATLAGSGGETALNAQPGQQLAGMPLPSSGRVGVIVIVPQYLDRPDVMVRTGDYEVVPLKNARWAESLSLTASRVVAADLGAALPNYEFVALPTGVDRRFDYRLAVELSRFDTDALGRAEMAGRWTIADGESERERMSGSFRYAASASATDAGSIAAALSGLLAKLSSEIVPGLQSSRLASRGPRSPGNQAATRGSMQPPLPQAVRQRDRTGS